MDTARGEGRMQEEDWTGEGLGKIWNGAIQSSFCQKELVLTETCAYARETLGKSNTDLFKQRNLRVCAGNAGERGGIAAAGRFSCMGKRSSGMAFLCPEAEQDIFPAQAGPDGMTPFSRFLRNHT